MEMAFHRILQLLTLEIVRDLVCRRLTHIQNRLTFQVVRLDLLTHGDPPHYWVRLCFGSACWRCNRARRVTILRLMSGDNSCICAGAGKRLSESPASLLVCASEPSTARFSLIFMKLAGSIFAT